MLALAIRESSFPLDICRSIPLRADWLVEPEAGGLHIQSVLKGVAAPLTDSRRKDLLRALADGEIVEIQIDFRAFAQLDGVSNANFLRFSRKILRKLARSFTGVPLLRDHSQDELDARAGTITRSSATVIDEGMAFDMTALVTAPWAVGAVLRGNLDRFSIGWAHGGIHTILCSVDNAPIFSRCNHLPGDLVENDDGSDQVVEFIFTEATGVEVSGVSVPAVQGTGISEIRAALSRARITQIPLAREESMDEIAKALGLQAEASREAILAAIAARSAAAQTATNRATELEGQLATATAELEQLRASEATRRVDAAFAEHVDRFPITRDDAGNALRSPLETQLRTLAASDLDAALGILASLPKQTAPQLQRTPRAPATPSAPPIEATLNNPYLSSVMRQLGLTPEQIAKYGPNGGN